MRSCKQGLAPDGRTVYGYGNNREEAARAYDRNMERYIRFRNREEEDRTPTASVRSSLTGEWINAQTGKPVKDDGKVLDTNGWRKE